MQNFNVRDDLGFNPYFFGFSLITELECLQRLFGVCFNPYFFGFSLITPEPPKMPEAPEEGFNPYFFGFSLITIPPAAAPKIPASFNPYFFGFSLITVRKCNPVERRNTVSTLIFLDLA